MRRREFIKLIAGSSAAWPFAFASRAQQPPRPVIGFLNGVTAQGHARPLAAFLKGLEETGYADGRNVALNIVGRTVNTIDCPRWQPTVVAKCP